MPPPPAASPRLLELVRGHAEQYLKALGDRPVHASTSVDELRAVLGGSLPEAGSDPETVVDMLAGLADTAMTASTSARFFGFVIGGALPAAMAVDMLTPVWDQNAGLFVAGPAASVAEETAHAWLIDLLGLPADASAGFVTGGQMANTTALAIARGHVLAAAGWDVEHNGLAGGPAVTVVAGRERHSTIDRAMRFVGLGGRPVLVEVDANGGMRADALAEALRRVRGPTIVCLQMGNVNTGALDPVGDLADIAHEHDAWVHVDGAFGLWARVLPSLREQTAGTERADSWAVDAHKWLNVPYDSGLIFTAHATSHRAATGTDHGQAAYLQFGEDGRDELEWTPEFSRRGRGLAVWAALRSLGRHGVVEMIDRCCVMARRFAEQLSETPGVTVRNDVVLNQVLVGFEGVPASDVITAVQAEGTCWPSGTIWHGENLMRISVSNWQTVAEDVDRSVQAIVDEYRSLRNG
jgi:glutamate/tyrosine decarboxylase-like PLP-dependent enzyme